MRVTNRKLAEVVAAARQADPGVAVTVRADVLPGDRSLIFHGVVSVGAVVHELAASNGKLKTFSALDDLVRYVAEAAPVGSGAYALTVETGVVLSAPVPVDLVKAAAAKVAKLQKAKTAQQAVVTSLDGQLALMAGWGSGSPLQVARFAEVTQQKATVLADIGAIDAEIIRLTP